jgi:hypothetical protein
MQPCSFAFFGCAFSGTEFDVQLHERDAVVLHLRLVATRLQTVMTTRTGDSLVVPVRAAIDSVQQSLGNALIRSDGVTIEAPSLKHAREPAVAPVGQLALLNPRHHLWT